MDRLKQEWNETIIPDEVRLRARNLAWEKIRRPSGGRRALGWAAAATTVVAMAVLVWIWSGREMRDEQVAAPAPQNVSRPAVAANQTIKPLIETPPTSKPRLFKRHFAPKRASAPADEPERIVLNFRLHESGARMIWIMDSRFHLDGGVQ